MSAGAAKASLFPRPVIALRSQPESGAGYGGPGVPSREAAEAAV